MGHQKHMRAQRRSETRRRWVKEKFDRFEGLVSRLLSKDFFAGCAWTYDERFNLVDIWVPTQESARFNNTLQKPLDAMAIKAGLSGVRVSVVSPECLNGLLDCVDPETGMLDTTLLSTSQGGDN